MYNSFSSISIMANDDINAIAEYIGFLGSGKHLIKSGSQIQFNHVSKLRSFTNLTTDRTVSVESGFRILTSWSVDIRFQDLLDIAAHTAEEMNHLIGDNGIVYFIEANNIPVSCCVVYQNFANIWEIGAVSTLGNHRRKGFAKVLVSEATNYLLSNNCIPRYNVNSENQGSLKLALSCGYTKFLELTHYQVGL